MSEDRRVRVKVTVTSEHGHGIYRLEAVGYEVETGWDDQFGLPAIRWRSKPDE